MARKANYLLILVSLASLFAVLHASPGDEDPLYRSCVEVCERNGDCRPSASDISFEAPEIAQKWRRWSCRRDCRRGCVVKREKERRDLGLEPVKYHGYWPNTSSSFLQDAIIVALPVLNLLANLQGWFGFFRLEAKSCDYALLWHVHGFLATNAWFWCSAFHALEFETTERIAFSTTVALIAYSLVLSIIHTFKLRNEESIVIVAAPILGFASTHICYLSFTDYDYEWNKLACGIMCMAQVFLWFMWANKTRHHSMHKVWKVCIGSVISLILDITGHRALWHSIAIPLTYVWWSFVQDNAQVLLASQPMKRKDK